MVQIQFLEHLHLQVAVVVLEVGETTEILEAPVVVEVEVQLDLPGRVALEQQIKATQVAAEQPITQTGGQVVAVAVLQRLGKIP